MDITSIINSISPTLQNSGTGAGSNLPEKFLSDLGKYLTNSKPTSNFGGVIKADGNNTYIIKLPSLSNVVKNVESLTIKTASPIDNIGNFKIQGNSFSFTNIKNNPVLKIEGTITQIPNQNLNSASQPTSQSTTQNTNTGLTSSNNVGSSAHNSSKSASKTDITLNNPRQNPNSSLQEFSKPIKFISEISLSKNFSADISKNSAAQNQLQNSNIIKTDGVNLTPTSRPNLTNLSAYTNQVSSLISSKIIDLPNVSSLKINEVTSYNLQVKSFTYPSGKTLNINQNIAIDPAKIISGKTEFSPQNRETIIKTDFGNFRVPGELSLPNNSKVNFVINSISNIKPEAQINETINLNLSSVKLALEGEGSTLQNLANNLSNLPHSNSILSRLFPNFNDKQSFARSLWFISSSNTGSADKWLGNDGINFIRNNIPNPESVLSNLKEVFGLLKNINHNPQASQNLDSWYNYLIPFYEDKKLEFMSFYVQPRDNGNKTKQKEDSRKFIVEFEQSELGKVVIEGAFLEESKRIKNLDLHLNSSNGFSQDFADEISVLFKDVSNAYGFTGKIDFSNNIPPNYKNIINKNINEGIVI